MSQDGDSAPPVREEPETLDSQLMESLVRNDELDEENKLLRDQVAYLESRLLV